MEPSNTPTTEVESPYANVDPRLLKLAQLSIEGKTRNAIAAELGISSFYVYHLRQKPEFKALMDSLLGDTIEEVKSKFKARSNQAADNIYILATTAQNERVKLAANQDILDRTPGLAIKHETEVKADVRLGADVLALFAVAARELGTGRAPNILERVLEAERVLPDEERPWTEQARRALTQGTG